MDVRPIVAGTVGDLRGVAFGPTGDLREGDFSLGSRLPSLVGDTRLSLPRGCLAGDTGSGSRGEIWWEARAERSEPQLSRRSPGEVDSTSWANLGRGSDIGSADAEVLRWLASLTGAAS